MYVQHCFSRHWALNWRISFQHHIIVVTCHTVKRILHVSLSCSSSSPSASFFPSPLCLFFAPCSSSCSNSTLFPSHLIFSLDPLASAKRGLKFCLILDPNPQSCSTLCCIQNYSKKNATVDDFLEALNAPLPVSLKGEMCPIFFCYFLLLLNSILPNI